MSAATRLHRLEAQDVPSMSVAEAHAALRDLSMIRGAADRLEGAIARRLTDLHEAGNAIPTADVLARSGRNSRKAAERAERRARTLGHTPKLNEALGDGRVGAEHADALANAAWRLTDDQRTELFALDGEITELAASQSPEKFRRRLTKIVDDITDDDGLDRAEKQADAANATMRIDEVSGMHVLHAQLTPEQGNRVRRSLDAEVAILAKRPENRGRRREQLAADAVTNLVTGERLSPAAGPAEVAVLIDHRTLVSGPHDATISEYSDGSPVPVATARRHACDAKLIPVVLGGAGVPLDVGRARRLATPAQRTALRSMYRTCAIDGCDRHFDRCDIHHIDEWDDLGPTDLINLLPLCSFHHHRVHEGRWRLQLDPSSRQLDVWLPDGTRHSRSLPDLIEEQRAA